MSTPPARVGTWDSLKAVTRSWRLLSVALLSFSSGLPLGLVWIAIPTWLAREGVDVRTVGLITLSQAPWSFKFLWSPLMDRWAPGLLGRKRGWMLTAQVVLLLLGLGLAASSVPPLDVVLIGLLATATAFASASQDVAYDAWTVEVLRREEHGLAVGARNALARAALFVSGRVSITAAAFLTWPVTHALLAACYVPAAIVTWFAPEPEQRQPAPAGLKEALWRPFVELLALRRSLAILAFVVLYKLGDNLAQVLGGPFLVSIGFDDVDVGVALGTVGLVATVGGTFFGGLASDRWGLGRALWVFGLLQIFSNVGYAVVAMAGLDRAVMYGAMAFEAVTSGMGTGALAVFLLRLTSRRFSATQFALLSSLFAISRIFTGPVAGVLVDAIGWRDFFFFSVLPGVPGLVMLARFAPWSEREPRFEVEPPRAGRPASRAAVAAVSLASGLAGFALAIGTAALVEAIRVARGGAAFDLARAASGLLMPARLEPGLTLAGCLVVGVTVAVSAAAILVARRGLARS
jgi:PAT family beta-lactamase induction signal transducer AmpG